MISVKGNSRVGETARDGYNSGVHGGPDAVLSQLAHSMSANEWWEKAVHETGRSCVSPQAAVPASSGEPGILLVGGSGARLMPVTENINKHMLSIGGQPVCFYPLTNLIRAGVTNLLVSTSKRDLPVFQEMLGTGEQFGISINYHIQGGARGVASAVADCFECLQDRPAMVALGDTVFVGAEFPSCLRRLSFGRGLTLPLFDLKEPERSECVEFSKSGEPVDFHEKPDEPPSAKGCGGLYIFDPRAKEFGREAPLSPRGEFDVNAINRSYRDAGEVKLAAVPRGVQYFDAGRFETLAELTEQLALVSLEERIMIYSPHLAAYQRGNISFHALVEYCSERACSSQYFSDVLGFLSNPTFGRSGGENDSSV